MTLIKNLRRIQSLIVAFATVALVAIGVQQCIVMQESDETQRLVNRAWLSPIGAEIDMKSISEDGVTYIVFYKNTGKLPARNFVAQQEFDVIRALEKGENWYNVFSKEKITGVCERTKSEDGAPTISPSGDSTEIYTIKSNKIRLSKDITEGKRHIFIQGCFAYLTFNKPRKTPYCFIFLREVDTAAGELSFRSIRCPYGNAGAT